MPQHGNTSTWAKCGDIPHQRKPTHCSCLAPALGESHRTPTPTRHPPPLHRTCPRTYLRRMVARCCCAAECCESDCDRSLMFSAMPSNLDPVPPSPSGSSTDSRMSAVFRVRALAMFRCRPGRREPSSSLPSLMAEPALGPTLRRRGTPRNTRDWTTQLRRHSTCARVRKTREQHQHEHACIAVQVQMRWETLAMGGSRGWRAGDKLVVVPSHGRDAVYCMPKPGVCFFIAGVAVGVLAVLISNDTIIVLHTLSSDSIATSWSPGAGRVATSSGVPSSLTARVTCDVDSSGGELCYFRNTTLCVGFGNRRVVGIDVDSADDPFVRAYAGMNANLLSPHPPDHISRFFSRSPFVPTHYNMGVGNGSAVPGVKTVAGARGVGFGPAKVWPEVVHMVPVVMTADQLAQFTSGKVTYVDGYLYAVMYRGRKIPVHVGHWMVSAVGLLTAQMQVCPHLMYFSTPYFFRSCVLPLRVCPWCALAMALLSRHTCNGYVCRCGSLVSRRCFCGGGRRHRTGRASHRRWTMCQPASLTRQAPTTTARCCFRRWQHQKGVLLPWRCMAAFDEDCRRCGFSRTKPCGVCEHLHSSPPPHSRLLFADDPMLWNDGPEDYTKPRPPQVCVRLHGVSGSAR